MPAPTGAIVFRDATITVDGDEYANQLSRARLVPDQNVQTMRTLVPDGVIQDVDSAVWTLELAGVQINAATGLAKALRDAAGTQVEVILQPKTGTGQAKATFTVLVLQQAFGGDQGQFLPLETTLPVIGAPVFSVSA